MGQIVGQLEVVLLAELARLQTDMDKAKRAVGNAMSAIDRSVAQASQSMVDYAAKSGVTTNDVINNARAMASAQKTSADQQKIIVVDLNNKINAAHKEAAAQQEIIILATNNKIKAAHKARADAEAAIINRAIAENAHFDNLKTQWTAHHKALADQEIAKTKAKQAAEAAFRQEVLNSELNFTHTGRGKSTAFLSDKGLRSGFDSAFVDKELAGYRKVEAAAAAAFAAANPHIGKLQKEALAAGTSVKGLSASMRNVPAQVTDIFVSLQGGQAPLTVLLQQGGQLKDMFGGIGPAFRALGGYLLGLVTPVSVVVAAVASMGAAFVFGRKETNAFRDALILSGNQTGVTLGQVVALRDAISAQSGASKSASAEILTLALNTSIASEKLQSVVSSSIKLEREAGVSAKDTVAQFAELGKDPLNASIKLNESLNFLTESTYAQIRALVEQGRTIDAAKAAQDAFADALDSRTGEMEKNVGTIVNAYRGLRDLLLKVKDLAFGIGAETGTAAEQALLKTNERIAELERRRPIGRSSALDQELEALKRIRPEQNAAVLAEIALANATGESKRNIKIRHDFLEKALKLQSQEKRNAAELLKAENETADAVKRGAITAKERTDFLADLRAKQAPKVRSTASRENAFDKASAELDVLRIQKALESELQVYATFDKKLSALRSAGLLSEKDYLDTRKLTAELAAQTQEKALKDEITRMRERTAIGKTALDRSIAQLDIDKKVLELESKLTKTQDDAASGAEIAAIQQTDALRKIAIAYEEAGIAAQNYIDVARKSYDRTLSGIGIGGDARLRQAAIDQINDKYDQQALQNEKFKRENTVDGGFNNSDNAKKYTDELELIKRFRAEALALDFKYFEEKNIKERDVNLAAQEAINNYLDQSKNVYNQASDAFTNAFKGMEDALVTFVTTGKLSFSSLANSILVDITRIIVKQQISNALGLAGAPSGGGFFGSLLGAVVGGGQATPNYESLGDLSGFDGGGYTGSGSRSGGLDGKGGFVAMLHPQETVVDHTKGQQAGNTVNITVNQTFAAGTSRATTMQAAADARRQLEYAGRNL